MGSPKQLLTWHGQALVERITGAMSAVTERVVVVGNGPLPEQLAELTRLADIPESDGPLAGILACLRWATRASWFIAACDLPLLEPAALEWLDKQRTPGRWAVLPRVDADRIEPLLALYEPRSRWLLEQLVRRDERAPRHIADHPAVVCPQLPEHLAPAWTNINHPHELLAL
jgi:molybdopterin-guanine dinucleotide biosynthesis protein A